MANLYFVYLTVKGEKETLDEIQALFQQEVDEGQTLEHYYTMHKSLQRMGYDYRKMDWKSYTSNVQRESDNVLHIDYIGAWSAHPQVFIAIREKWPVKIDWEGMDEFGQYPRTTYPKLVGKYQIEDGDEGLNPFTELPEWASEEEALPAINGYYHTNCKSLQEALDNIDRLCCSERMEFYKEEYEDVKAVRDAKIG